MVLQTGRAQKIEDLTHIAVDVVDFAVVELIKPLDGFLVAQHCQALGRGVLDIVAGVVQIRIRIRAKEIIRRRGVIGRVRFKKVDVEEEVFGLVPIEPIQCKSCR